MIFGDNRMNPHHDEAPWLDESAVRWLATLDSWPRLAQLLQKTLQQDPLKFPHQIRAAAALTIMIAREGLWPRRGNLMDIESVAGLARRQLAQVKQLISTQTRIDRDLVRDRSVRTLLESLDEELRNLESRASTDFPPVRQEPPRTWGKFWYQEE